LSNPRPVSNPRLYYECPEGMNPTDYLLDVVTPDVKVHVGDEVVGSNPEGFVKYYDENCRTKDAALVANAIENPGKNLRQVMEARHKMLGMFKWQPVDDSKYCASFYTQFSWCLWRKLKIMARDPSQGVGQIGVMVVMGLLSSIIYQGLGDDKITGIDPKSAFTFSNNLALLVQMGMLPVYLCLANLNVYCDEKVVALHEAEGGMYSPMAFLLATTLAPLPISCIAVFMGSFLQWAIGLGFVSEYIGFGSFIIIYSSACCGFIAIDSLFQLFAYLMPDAEQAQGPAILCFTFFQMFNGFAPSPSAYPSWLRWGIWVSPTYYQTAIVVDSFFIENGNNHTSKLADDFGFEDRGVEMWFAFLGWIIVFRMLSAYVLSTRKLDK